jgi:type IV pilus assembly protein PilE
MLQQTFRPRTTPGVRTAGFTLMEVMIVIVILGVLMAIGLPSYQESLRKGRRSEAMAGLMDVANRQEQLMLDRSRYTADLTQLGYADPFITQEGHYAIVAAACDSGVIATCYKLTATPQSTSPQIKDTKCGSFILDSKGAKTVTGPLPADQCW